MRIAGGADHTGLVVACSALKQQYREIIADRAPVAWVYLKGTEEVVRARILKRQHHFFKAQMLASQCADLEEPAGAIVVGRGHRTFSRSAADSGHIVSRAS